MILNNFQWNLKCAYDFRSSVCLCVYFPFCVSFLEMWQNWYNFLKFITALLLKMMCITSIFSPWMHKSKTELLGITNHGLKLCLFFNYFLLSRIHNEREVFTGWQRPYISNISSLFFFFFLSKHYSIGTKLFLLFCTTRRQ